MSLTISLASKRRSLSNNWFFDEGELIEINLTQAQWAELLSSFNRGPGVPCTLNHVNAELATEHFPSQGVPSCPETNERQIIEEEFKKEMANITRGLNDLIKKAQEFQDKPSINKADRKAYLDIATTLQRKIDSCLPFIQGQFNEAMDGVIVQAKHDIEAFTSQLLRQAGLDKIKDQVAALSETATQQIEDHRPQV